MYKLVHKNGYMTNFPLREGVMLQIFFSFQILSNSLNG
jgi:hypothetical protein